MAAAGLTLGIVGLLGWAGVGIAGWWFYESSRIPRRIAEQYITDLAAGDVRAVLAMSMPSTSPHELRKAVDYLNQWGPLHHVNFTSFRAFTRLSGRTTWTFRGKAIFERGSVAFAIEVTQTGSNTYVVRSANLTQMKDDANQPTDGRTRRVLSLRAWHKQSVLQHTLPA